MSGPRPHASARRFSILGLAVVMIVGMVAVEAGGLVVTATSAAASSGASGSVTLSYTGADQSFVAPPVSPPSASTSGVRRAPAPTAAQADG